MAKRTKKAQTQTQSAEQTNPVEQYNVADLMEEFGTKSAVIRHLAAEGLTRSQIVKAFDASEVKMRYQHVRNVLVTPLKREGAEA